MGREKKTVRESGETVERCFNNVRCKQTYCVLTRAEKNDETLDGAKLHVRSNTRGTCLPGYTGDGFTCENVNECDADP